MDIPLAKHQERTYDVNGPIRQVLPLEGFVLRVIFDAGGIMDVPLKKHLSHPRLQPLRDERVFRNVDTNRRFVHWYREDMEVAELAWEELIGYAIGEHWQ